MSQIRLEELTKLYYSIGEVAEMFGVSTSLIRYWESEFQFLKPQKTQKGDRRFTKQNIEQLQIIFNLVKEKGYTLDGAKKEIKENRSKLLLKHRIREKLLEIRLGLIAISNKLG
jgi:DNA-binding transcriptional MerR regulator